MNIILSKTTTITHQVHHYDNGMAYVEYWHNSRLKDAFFALSSGLWPDGSVRPGHRKYFYSPTGEKVVKPLAQLSGRAVEDFSYFELLRSITEDGKLLDFEGREIVES